MSKPQRWDWAIGIELKELSDKHLQAAYKLNWDNLCKFDSCRKNCKRILCLACFDKSWIDNDSPSTSTYDIFEVKNFEQKRKDLKTFVGLKNLGATCYVNCLLQLWFHNPALRKAIYECDPTAGPSSGATESTHNNNNSNNNNNNNNKDRDNQDNNNRRGGDRDALMITDGPRDSRSTDKEASAPNPSPSTTPPPANQNSNSTSAASLSISSAAKSAKNITKISGNNEKTCKQLLTVNELPVSSSSTMSATTSSSSSSTCNQQNNNNNTTSAAGPNITKSKEVANFKPNPIEQLQLIFARMQFTNKKSIDPFSFIESLALNAAEQQDAQEFGNLFMEFLEKSFANQNNAFVSKIIQNQFCGRYSYATICDQCKHNSLSESNFYELDLSIQGLETLNDALKDYFRPVPLDGEWNCSACKKLQKAHRKIILKSLPPTLNLQLLRFVYDKQRGSRQKINSHIIFPEILDMSPYLKDGSISNSLDLSRNEHSLFNGHSRSSNGSSRSNIYVLSAVLIHRGSSPHSGHYIAHIKDRITKEWFKFNDDSVERIGPQLQVSAEGESITIVEDRTEIIKISDSNSGKTAKLESKSLKSKTAYMLVYQAQNNEAFTYPSDHSEKWILPDHLQTAVAEENSRSDELFESLQVAKDLDQRMINARKDQIRSIYDKLVCRGPDEEFEFIDRNWLQQWLTDSSTSANFPPIDNSHLLCIHGKLDFRKVDQVKCVRTEGVDLIYKEFGGGPRLKDAMCKSCVELEVRLIQFKERMKEDQKFITSQAKFKLDANYDFADAYIIGKNSYRDWQALVMCQFEKSYPELSRRARKDRNGNQQISSDEDDNKVDRNAVKEYNESTKNTDSNPESDDEAMEKFVFNSDILCEHNQLLNDTSAWRIVPKEVWVIFKRYFGDNPSRPLIELNANTIMCPECKRQEVEQQEIDDVQKQKAIEQKSRLHDLFHNKKRASWCSMQPGDEYYALDRQFLIKWQKFIRHSSNQEKPIAIRNRDRLLCDHGKLLYNHSNSNPILPECPFVLISLDELEILKNYYPIDEAIRFSIDSVKADEKLKLHMNSIKASLKAEAIKKPFDSAGDRADVSNYRSNNSSTTQNNNQIQTDYEVAMQLQESMMDEPMIPAAPADPIPEPQIDYTEIDWSNCVVSDPDYCSYCHEVLKQDELRKLLNYESATIYITKVESSTTYGPHNNPAPTSNGINDNCDSDKQSGVDTDTPPPNVSSTGNDVEIINGPDEFPFKRRKKIYIEDEANDFVPPGASGRPATTQSSPSSNSMLRRTTRRNRSREQAYTIKPTQTLLQLKKEIFQRCQVLPSDQRLFLNDCLLSDNSKTMSELRIVPNCALKLEIDRPVSDTLDLIEDETPSRKSCAQPETGFKGSLLLSNSHF